MNGPVFKTCDSPESRVVLDGAPADLVAVMEQLAAWIADPSNPQPPMDAGLAAWIQSAHPKYRWTPMSFNASWAVEGSGPRTAVVHQEFWKRRTFKAGLDILIWHDDGTGWKLTDARLDRFSLGTWGNPDPYRVCDWAGNLNACQGDNPAP